MVRRRSCQAATHQATEGGNPSRPATVGGSSPCGWIIGRRRTPAPDPEQWAKPITSTDLAQPGKRTAPLAHNCRSCSSVVSTMPPAPEHLREACAIAARPPLLPAVTAGSTRPGVTSTRGMCGILRSRCRQTAAARFPRRSDDRQRIHIVWPTLVPADTAGVETLALFYATSADGQHFTTRQRVPTQGVPRHPQIAVGLSGEIAVAWDEQAGGARRVALARGAIDPSGVARLVRQTIVDAAPAVYPVLAAVDDGMVVAWTSGPGGQTVIRAERLDK